MKSQHGQHGMTLIELMVTLAITGVVLAGVINLYVGSISQSKLTGNLAAMQESGRFALELLSRDIRMAGFTGCLAYDALEDDDNATPEQPEAFWGLYTRGGAAFTQQALRGIQGWEADTTALGDTVDLVSDSTMRTGTSGGDWTTSPTGAGGNTLPENYEEAIDNSDIVRLWTAGEVAVDISDVASTEASLTLTAPAGHGFDAGDLIMFATCGQRVLGQVCSVTGNQLDLVSGSSGTCNNAFRDGFTISDNADGAEAFSYRDVTYFVGKRDDGGNTPPSLYRAVGDTAREMVEGVESMQILYGVDLDHIKDQLRTADVYLTADEVDTRWSDVVSVRISVLMRSFETGLVSGPQTFNFNNVPHVADDGYLRQVYSTTIALRNRTVGVVDGLFAN